MDSRERYELEADRHRQAWQARERPDNELPVAVPLNAVIGKGERAVAFIAGATVYSNGVDLALEVRSAAPANGGRGADPFDHQRTFSLALEYADGRRYVHGRSPRGLLEESLDSINLMERGGSAGPTGSTTHFYLTPAPPLESMYVYFEWPALGIPKTKTRIVTRTLSDAAERVQRLWPAAGLATEPIQRRAARSSAVNPGLLQQLFESEMTPLVRTDFSDDAAWATVVRRLTRAVDFEDPDPVGSPIEERDLDDISPDHGDADLDGAYTPNVEVIDHSANEGMTPDHLVEMFSLEDAPYGYVLLADGRSMTEANGESELTVVYVNLSWDPEYDEERPRQFFRVVDTEFASIEANLSIANLDFEDFLRATDPDGVFRGFGHSDGS